MSKPYIHFYPGDWARNSNVRRCTLEERGAWIEVLFLMHDSERYGVLQWPLKDIAASVGAPLSVVKALHIKGVLKGCDEGPAPEFVYRPKTGNKANEAIALISSNELGPIWYSSRMVKDQHMSILKAHKTSLTLVSKVSPELAVS